MRSGVRISDGDGDVFLHPRSEDSAKKKEGVNVVIDARFVVPEALFNHESSQRFIEGDASAEINALPKVSVVDG
jgi:hypothetical protein